MPSDGASVVTGVLGVGLVLFGGVLFLKTRSSSASGVHGLGRARYAQAPVVGGYSDGNMKTVLRASREMPIEQRIATIQDLIHKSVQDPEMRKVALAVTRQCPERDQKCEAKAIYQFVKARIRYSGDVGPIQHPDGSVEGIDLYQSARRSLEFGAGDCDDQAILNSTLLSLNGIEPKLRVVRQHKAPDWEHIYSVAVINGKEFALDTTLPGNNRFGYELPVAKMIDFPA